MTCAEPPPTAPNYRIAHVKKKKAGNDVCGAAGEKGYVHAKKKKVGNDVCGATPSSAKLLHCTRQKEKKQEIACAEPPPTAPNYRIVHAKKKKAGNDVCGATSSSAKLPYCTRQKEKSRKWRVRRAGKRGTVHVKKKKAGNGVCGATGRSPPPAGSRNILKNLGTFSNFTPSY